MKFKFITGGAGVGKSHTLRQMVAGEQRKFVVVAPTGIAAINCNGVTIHSAFRIDPNNGFVDPKIRRGPLAGLQVIYIDEVSMVSAELMESIYTAANMLGVEEIIAFGDLAQLKPVRGGWFFEFKEPDEIQRLTTCYRQGNDAQFATALNFCRVGLRTDCEPITHHDILAHLNSHKGDTEQGVTLAYSNDTVNRINAQSLENIDAPVFKNVADIYGNMTARDVIAPEVLEVKPGADVIMLNNDKEKRWQNGTRGKVMFYVDDAEYIAVDINGVAVNVYCHTWQKRVPRTLTEERREYWEQQLHSIDDSEKELARHNLKNGYELEVVGSFTQYPIKLGYASTVHKSQGLTLDNVIIRPDGFNTTHGLGYVALSRLTTLQGLTTYRKLRKDDFVCNPKVLPYL